MFYNNFTHDNYANIKVCVCVCVCVWKQRSNKARPSPILADFDSHKIIHEIPETV